MLSLVKKALAFLIVAIIFYVCSIIIVGLVLPDKFIPNMSYRVGNKGHLYLRLRDLESRDSVDVLLLGSSHAYRGVDTRITKASGVDLFNLGSSAQTPRQTEYLLNRHLNRLNPKLVIYEIDPFNFESDGIESTIDLISNTYIDKELSKMAFSTKNIKVINTWIYALFRQLVNLNDNYQPPTTVRQNTYIKGGFVSRKTTEYRPSKTSVRGWNPRVDQLVAFERNLEKIKSSGAELKLAYFPVTKQRYTALTELELYRSHLERLAELSDFNQSVELNDSLHFYDAHHLNEAGAQIFTHELIRQLIHQ